MGHLDDARAEIERATATDAPRDIHEQLQSIDEGLMEMTEAEAAHDDPEKTRGDTPFLDDIEEVEHKLAGLADNADGETAAHIRAAAEHLFAYRERAAE